MNSENGCKCERKQKEKKPSKEQKCCGKTTLQEQDEKNLNLKHLRAKDLEGRRMYDSR